jgi:hypothetical protein
MFRNSNLQSYFLRVGVSKSAASGASSSIGNTTCNAFGNGDYATPVAALGTEVANLKIVVQILATLVIELGSLSQ